MGRFAEWLVDPRGLLRLVKDEADGPYLPRRFTVSAIALVSALRLPLASWDASTDSFGVATVVAVALQNTPRNNQFRVLRENVLRVRENCTTSIPAHSS